MRPAFIKLGWDTFLAEPLVEFSAAARQGELQPFLTSAQRRVKIISAPRYGHSVTVIGPDPIYQNINPISTRKTSISLARARSPVRRSSMS